MKILFIIPGSGDSFYCGNCFRDNLQASALRKAGYDVVIMPLYLPLKDPSFQADTPLFFSAVTFYVAQKFFGKRKMPAWLKRLTGSERMLELASSLSGTTSAADMEKMTLSMITGNDPAFNDPVTPLINWIKEQEKPDIIHLSSTLLLGIVKMIREEMDIPVVCSVQDEEVWIDSLPHTHASAAWQGIADNICNVDTFITTSHFYREQLRKRIPQMTEVKVIYPGVDAAKYASAAYPATPVIAFFSRMNRENGLDILAEAFVKLKKRNTIPQLKLKIGGGYTSQDNAFLKKINRMLSPYKKDVEICQSYNLDDHLHFYRSISVLSVPIIFEESIGLYLCEAFAAGCPAVEPDTGSFHETVNNAGLLYSPNNSDALADALEKLLTDEQKLAGCRANALRLSSTRYSETALAEKLIETYTYLIE